MPQIGSMVDNPGIDPVTFVSYMTGASYIRWDDDDYVHFVLRG